LRPRSRTPISTRKPVPVAERVAVCLVHELMARVIMMLMVMLVMLIMTIMMTTGRRW
jgi:hypothetical protein